MLLTRSLSKWYGSCFFIKGKQWLPYSAKIFRGAGWLKCWNSSTRAVKHRQCFNNPGAIIAKEVNAIYIERPIKEVGAVRYLYQIKPGNFGYR
jgi:hypothetical protein